jgi:CBS domain-containing protein
MNIGAVLASKGVKVVTVRPTQTLREAVLLLAEHNIGAVVVTEASERPSGILSERDIVRTLVRAEAVLDWPVSRIMTRDVIVGALEDDVLTVGHTMIERRIRHLPVMQEGRLVGIVSIGDILKAQRDKYQGEVDTLQLQLLKGPA